MRLIGNSPCRTQWIFIASLVIGLLPNSAQSLTPTGKLPPPDLRDRIRGLLLGSFIGDAVGGPVEFQNPVEVRRLPNPPKQWSDHEILTDDALRETAKRLILRPYAPLRPVPESYAHWSTNAAPGTITDDSRHKLVLLEGLRNHSRNNQWPFRARDMAQTFLQWPNSDRVRNKPGYAALRTDWLEEWELGSRWILGERNLSKALPPERIWSGVPTCSGQMTLLPLAALYPKDPARAYRAAYDLAFFDQGFGKDLNSALVGLLAEALGTPTPSHATPAVWDSLLRSLRETDPYGYGRIRWVQRPVHRWLNLALKMADQAQGRPARLFAQLEKEFQHTTKWEAQVPFVVSFSCLALCRYDPLASIQLSIEWGHDTDSYAQLTGALVGALHGAKVFPPNLALPVQTQLRADYDEDLDQLVDLLDTLRTKNLSQPLIGE